jgi:ATP-dependent RNA helicase DDX49/DBP8
MAPTRTMPNKYTAKKVSNGTKEKGGKGTLKARSSTGPNSVLARTRDAFLKNKNNIMKNKGLSGKTVKKEAVVAVESESESDTLEGELEDIEASDESELETESDEDIEGDSQEESESEEEDIEMIATPVKDVSPPSTVPAQVAAPKTTFDKLGLDRWLIESLAKVGISTPTDIQSHCIPQILAGKDIIASAKTGSGKTASFALPILHALSQDPYGVFCLVLAPTRELAFQIAEQFRVLGSSINLKQSVVVGGMDMMAQSLELSQRPHVVVATPGRLVDLIQSSPDIIHFKRIKYLVLDEADRLLTQTFHTDLSVIFDAMPKQRQTLLFTATMTDEIVALQNTSKKPFVYTASKPEMPHTLLQHYIFIPSAVREAYLVHMLRTSLADKPMIIFTSKARTCEVVRLMLKTLGIRSTALHSSMPQPDRIAALAKFKSQVVPVLISTDVGSRGLDIPSVAVVLNYELPASAADYIHRVGRTARASRGGMSVSIVTERDVAILQHIEKQTGVTMTEYKVSEDAVVEIMNEVAEAKRGAALTLLENKFGERKRINKEKEAVLGGSK